MSKCLVAIWYLERALYVQNRAYTCIKFSLY
nr:MAG TPA: hypothetical protein [Caudoviricetes sp.]